MSTRIVITGIGVVSPIGRTRAAFWESCLAGRSGAATVDSPWVAETDLSTRIAARVLDHTLEDAGLQKRDARVLDRNTIFALGAAREALLDAGFELVPNPESKARLGVAAIDPFRFASIVGSGVGGLTTVERSHAIWRAERSKKSVRRFSLPMLIPNAPAAQVAARFGARGECKSISTACAAGTMAIGDACRLLRRGEADVVLAGGSEGVAGDEDAYGLMGFERLKVLSTRNEEPARASRPFDLRRDGFVLGEGAGLLVLEREEHAAARGAPAYAAVEGYASNCDAFSMLQLDPSGEAIIRLIEAALRDAGIPGSEVDYVSAHGTSTLLNDKTEARVLRSVFGSRCDRIPVTALKSMTGHAIAGSGPMETAAAVLSLRDGVLAPTINYDYPDPECDLDVVANAPRSQQVSTCVKLSYGFGGHNACLVLRRL